MYVNTNKHEDALWRNTQVYNIPQSSVESLQTIINGKEKKFNQYKKYDETWLLVIIDFINFGMDQEIGNIDFSPIHISEFDKVILYKTGFDEIIELSKSISASSP